MAYRAPVSDIAFMLHHMRGAGQENDALGADLIDSILEEAGRFASEELAATNVQGDREGARLENGVVTLPEGWPDLYRRWREGGWNGLMAAEEHGGQGLPVLVWAAVSEMWASANMAFSLAPMLTHGTIEALTVHGSEELQRLYLPKLVSGEWTGTMNLTEPQAGSDLAALKTRATPDGEGGYRIKGSKIFITFGEHDLAENIVHMVLARLPDAPAGTKGISLFLTPKYLVRDDGSLGPRNDLRCHSIEHKMGIHASPTCAMVYGDGEGATAFLVGEENRGLACMFTMMNNARLGVGLEGVAVAEAALQKALRYAYERLQGREAGVSGMVPIVRHPDVRRMLMTMRALTMAARAICYRTAAELDRARAGDKDARDRADLLTPIAKAFSTDIGVEVASLGVQVHGGMGFIEETGAAQYLRDARIAPIYEGTNGIQAIDLVSRKLLLTGGACVAKVVAGLRGDVDAARNARGWDRAAGNLEAAVEALEEATRWMTAEDRDERDRLAGATPYLRLFGLAAGGCALANAALADGDAARLALARFFAEHLAPEAPGLARSAMAGAAALDDDGAEAALAIG